MKLNIFTICLDGEPFIRRHLPVFEATGLDFHWVIVEGAASNVKDTRWCRTQIPRLSNDGTTDYLNSIKGNPRVSVIQKVCWDGGKVQMVNAAVDSFRERGVLLQADSDEIWAPGQLKEIVRIFTTQPMIESMQFFCRYFVGPDLITTTENAYGNNPGEWMRAWRQRLRSDRFRSHEPPVYTGKSGGRMMTRQETRKHGLVFDHFAYALEKQVAYKEKFYGYDNAVSQWRKLQACQQFPQKLQNFLKWSDERATVERIKEGGLWKI